MTQCRFCDGSPVEQLTTFVHEDGDQFWIVCNMPAFVCTRCGEKEYSQETTQRVLSLLQRRPREILHVPVYELAAA